jgi:hypothetical protein
VNGSAPGLTRGPPPGGWTWRSATRRARAVLREEGWWGLWMRVLGELFYRRMLVLEGTVADPPPRFPTDEELEFAPLDPADLDDYLSFRPDQAKAEIERRLAREQVCFAARERGRIVQACWFVPPPGAWIDYLGWELPLGPHEAYIYDMWATPTARGRYLFRAQMSEMFAYFSDHGQRVRWFPDHAGSPDAPYGFVAAFHVENRIWALFARSGLRPREIVGFVGVGPLRWRFRRPAPNEEQLRRAARRTAKRRRRRQRATCA